MHYNCQECNRLWSEYALATRHLLKLQGRLRIADTMRDDFLSAELSPMIDRASEECLHLRRQIELHGTMATGA